MCTKTFYTKCATGWVDAMREKDGVYHVTVPTCHGDSVFPCIKGYARLMFCVVLQTGKAMVAAPLWVDDMGVPKAVSILIEASICITVLYGTHGAACCFEQDRLVLDRVCPWFMHRSQRGLSSCGFLWGVCLTALLV